MLFGHMQRTLALVTPLQPIPQMCQVVCKIQIQISKNTQSTAVVVVVVVVVVSVIRHPSSVVVVVVVVVVVADKKISPRSLQKDHDGRCCLTERLGLATHV